MKSVVAISLVTFVLIFGGVALMSAHLGRAARQGDVAELGPEDYEAAERVFADIALERDRLQREREGMAGMQQALTAQEQALERTKNSLAAIIAKLEARQEQYVNERERSAQKLAKMYEAMKPDKAAPILASLDLEIVIDIMSRMKERPAAKILAKMDAGLAAQVSTRMSRQGGSG
jgi:flagellar motility protein MotE (MotC chaperone)